MSHPKDSPIFSECSHYYSTYCVPGIHAQSSAWVQRHLAIFCCCSFILLHYIAVYMALHSVHGPNEDPNPIVDVNETFSEVVAMDRRIFAGEVLAMDMAVKNITDSFTKAGLWKDTVLIFSTGTCSRPALHTDSEREGGGTVFRSQFLSLHLTEVKLDRE